MSEVVILPRVFDGNFSKYCVFLVKMRHQRPGAFSVLALLGTILGSVWEAESNVNFTMCFCHVVLENIKFTRRVCLK